MKVFKLSDGDEPLSLCGWLISCLQYSVGCQQWLNGIKDVEDVELSEEQLIELVEKGTMYNSILDGLENRAMIDKIFYLNQQFNEFYETFTILDEEVKIVRGSIKELSLSVGGCISDILQLQLDGFGDNGNAQSTSRHIAEQFLLVHLQKLEPVNADDAPDWSAERGISTGDSNSEALSSTNTLSEAVFVVHGISPSSNPIVGQQDLNSIDSREKPSVGLFSVRDVWARHVVLDSANLDPTYLRGRRTISALTCAIEGTIAECLAESLDPLNDAAVASAAAFKSRLVPRYNATLVMLIKEKGRMGNGGGGVGVAAPGSHTVHTVQQEEQRQEVLDEHILRMAEQMKICRRREDSENLHVLRHYLQSMKHRLFAPDAEECELVDLQQQGIDEQQPVDAPTSQEFDDYNNHIDIDNDSDKHHDIEGESSIPAGAELGGIDSCDGSSIQECGNAIHTNTSTDGKYSEDPNWNADAASAESALDLPNLIQADDPDLAEVNLLKTGAVAAAAPLSQSLVAELLRSKDESSWVPPRQQPIRIGRISSNDRLAAQSLSTLDRIREHEAEDEDLSSSSNESSSGNVQGSRSHPVSSSVKDGVDGEDIQAFAQHAYQVIRDRIFRDIAWESQESLAASASADVCAVHNSMDSFDGEPAEHIMEVPSEESASCQEPIAAIEVEPRTSSSERTGQAVDIEVEPRTSSSECTGHAVANMVESGAVESRDSRDNRDNGECSGMDFSISDAGSSRKPEQHSLSPTPEIPPQHRTSELTIGQDSSYGKNISSDLMQLMKARLLASRTEIENDLHLEAVKLNSRRLYIGKSACTEVGSRQKESFGGAGAAAVSSIENNQSITSVPSSSTSHRERRRLQAPAAPPPLNRRPHGTLATVQRQEESLAAPSPPRKAPKPSLGHIGVRDELNFNFNTKDGQRADMDRKPTSVDNHPSSSIEEIERNGSAKEASLSLGLVAKDSTQTKATTPVERKSPRLPLSPRMPDQHISPSNSSGLADAVSRRSFSPPRIKSIPVTESAAVPHSRADNGAIIVSVRNEPPQLPVEATNNYFALVADRDKQRNGFGITESASKAGGAGFDITGAARDTDNAVPVRVPLQGLNADGDHRTRAMSRERGSRKQPDRRGSSRSGSSSRSRPSNSRDSRDPDAAVAARQDVRHPTTSPKQTTAPPAVPGSTATGTSARAAAAGGHTNYQQIKNAISSVCLAGTHFTEQRNEVLDVLEFCRVAASSKALSEHAKAQALLDGPLVGLEDLERKVQHFIVMFYQSKTLSYRGIYALHPEQEGNYVRIHGKGPAKLSESSYSYIQKYLKFETSSKSFKHLPVNSFSNAVDAIILPPPKARNKMPGMV